MSTRLLSSIEPAPPGFAHCELTKRTLLTGPLVLLAARVEDVFAVVPDGRDRIEGLIITPGERTEPQQLGPLLWLVSLPAEDLPRLREVLGATLAAVESAVSLRERLTEALRLADRTRYDFQQTRDDYNKLSRRLIDDLERSKAIAAENARLYEQASAALRSRDEFLSIASHELKTPLTPMKLQIQTIRRRLEPDGDPKLKELAAKADRQLDRLSRLVEALLDVSRISLGKLTLKTEPTDLVALVEGVLDQFATELGRARCVVTVRGDKSVQGEWDPFRLEQVVVNLVSNSIKFAAGGTIDIKVENTDSDRARLTVSDRGIGIQPEDRARLFQRYERAVSSRQYGGLGLGLYISRQIVEAHGGTIRLEDRPGPGATFVVELPTKPQRAAEPPPQRESPEPGHEPEPNPPGEIGVPG